MNDISNITSEMERLHSGDRAAFWSLYRKAAPSLYPLALRILNDPMEARAALLDVFIALWTEPPELPWEIVSPEGWLLTQTRTAALTRLALRTAPTATVDEFIERPEASAFGALVQGWARLTEEQQESLLGPYLDAENPSVTAARLDLTEGSVLSLQKQALRSLVVAFGVSNEEEATEVGQAILDGTLVASFDPDDDDDEIRSLWAEGLAGLAQALPPLSPPGELQEQLQVQLFPDGEQGILARLGVVQAVVGAVIAAGILYLWVTFGQGSDVPSEERQGAVILAQ